MPQFPREISKWLEILYIIYEKYTDNRWFTRIVNNWYQASYISNPMQHVDVGCFELQGSFLWGGFKRNITKMIFILILMYIIQFNMYDKN